MSNSVPYDSGGFWQQFKKDLQNTRSHLTIMCPFLGIWRMRFLEEHLRPLAARGVVICLILQRSRAMQKSEADRTPDEKAEVVQFEALCAKLASWGCHITLRRKVHQKIAIIDGLILWEGSLNMLSHINNTDNMRRWNSKSEVRRMIDLHKLKECEKCQLRRKSFSAGDSKPETQLKQIGRILREQRKQAGLSSRQLSQISGIDHQRICQIETAIRVKALAPLLKLARSLDLDILLVPARLTARILAFVDQEADQHPS